MTDLLIGSVFTETNWSHIQQKFITKTTRNYHCVAFLNRINKLDTEGYEVIGSAKGVRPSNFEQMSWEHCQGLNVILEYFRGKPQYKHLLLLDSDCFPINSKWQKLLLDKVKSKSKIGAAVIRFENLTTFPHPCCILINRKALYDHLFTIEIGRSRTLLSEWMKDTCASLPSERFYPLLRTNEWNPHPVFFAIYGGMFYHHGCGSRKPHFRAQDYYLKRYDPKPYNEVFFQSPERFISLLQGGGKKTGMFI